MIITNLLFLLHCCTSAPSKIFILGELHFRPAVKWACTKLAEESPNMLLIHEDTNGFTFEQGATHLQSRFVHTRENIKCMEHPLYAMLFRACQYFNRLTAKSIRNLPYPPAWIYHNRERCCERIVNHPIGQAFDAWSNGAFRPRVSDILLHSSDPDRHLEITDIYEKHASEVCEFLEANDAIFQRFFQGRSFENYSNMHWGPLVDVRSLKFVELAKEYIVSSANDDTLVVLICGDGHCELLYEGLRDYQPKLFRLANEKLFIEEMQ